MILDLSRNKIIHMIMSKCVIPVANTDHSRYARSITVDKYGRYYGDPLFCLMPQGVLRRLYSDNHDCKTPNQILGGSSPQSSTKSDTNRNLVLAVLGLRDIPPNSQRRADFRRFMRCAVKSHDDITGFVLKMRPQTAYTVESKPFVLVNEWRGLFHKRLVKDLEGMDF